MSFDLFSLPPAPVIAPAQPLVGKIPLRWCQRQDVDALLHAIETGKERACCVAATGYGKGPMVAETAARLMPNGKVLVLIDRAHLVHQLAEEIERHLPSVSVGRVADGVLEGIWNPIVVSTVQAMYSGTPPLYEHKAFENTVSVVPDEAHKFFAPMFRSVPQHFINENKAKVVAFTATPVAANGAEWASFFDWTAPVEGPCMRTTGWCIRNGYLVPPQQAFIQANIRLSELNTMIESGQLQADQANEEVSDALISLLTDKSERDAAAFAKGVAEVIGERQSIIFTPARRPGVDVRPSELLSSWLRSEFTCDAVWGEKNDKADVLAKFKEGRPQALTNTSLLCEGFDAPNVSAVFICRILKQWRLAQQMVGRCLRPSPSIIPQLHKYDKAEYAEQRCRVIAESIKPNALVADLVGLDGRVLQASAIDILYGEESEDTRREMGELVKSNQRKPDDEKPPLDRDLVERAKSEIVRKQNERLAELARQRAMGGALPADVSVTYGTSPSHASPMMTPATKATATVGEMAMFVAMSAGKYDTERAKEMAQRFPRNQLRGMTQSLRKSMEKDNRRPDWNRARAAFPLWQPGNKSKPAKQSALQPSEYEF